MSRDVPGHARADARWRVLESRESDGVNPVDLRSDTVTQPDTAMRRVMAEASVGDDVLGDDPTVIALQEYTAELLGKECGLFVPSGTMANQVALHAQTDAGDELFVHAEAHIVYYEQGGAAVISGLQVRTFESADGTLDPGLMQRRVHTDADPHWAPTRIVALENTHNHSGGVVYPMSRIAQVRQFCDENGLWLHLDGARIWNAHVASGTPLNELAAPFDTVSVCLSKGLGAPIGSMVLGRRELLPRLQRARKLLGGGMRQAGIVAAAGLYAVKHNINRLKDDHRRAKILAEALSSLPALKIDLSKVQTNMVYADCRRSGLCASRLVERLGAAGVLASEEDEWTVRFVTHLGIGDEDIERSVQTIRDSMRDKVVDI